MIDNLQLFIPFFAPVSMNKSISLQYDAAELFVLDSLLVVNTTVQFIVSCIEAK